MAGKDLESPKMVRYGNPSPRSNADTLRQSELSFEIQESRVTPMVPIKIDEDNFL